MATYDGDSRKLSLYINGSRDVSQTLSSGPAQNANPTLVGRQFAGRADEVAVYNTALSALAVGQLYDYQASWYDTSTYHPIVIDADNPSVRLDLQATYIPKRDIVLAVVAPIPLHGSARSRSR